MWKLRFLVTLIRVTGEAEAGSKVLRNVNKDQKWLPLTIAGQPGLIAVLSCIVPDLPSPELGILGGVPHGVWVELLP